MHEEVIRVRLEPDEKKVVEAARNLRAAAATTGPSGSGGGGRRGPTTATDGAPRPDDSRRAEREQRDAARQAQREQRQRAQASARAARERDRQESAAARDARDQGRAVASAMVNPAGTVRALAATRVQSLLTASPAMRWIGRGAGGVGPAGGAAVGAAAVTGGVLLGADMIRRAAGQFMEGVRNYAIATTKFTDGIIQADPTRILAATNLTRLAGTQVSTLRNTVAGGAAGAGIGAVIGGAATGGPGAVIGGGVGLAAGAATGYFSSLLLSWFTSMRSQVQEMIFGTLDGLLASIRNYNGRIFGLAQQYELKQKMFLINLGRYTEGVAAAWLDFKSKVLEVTASMMPRLRPLFDSVINYLSRLQDQIPNMVAGLLDGAGSVIDGFVMVRNALQSFVGTVGTISKQGIFVAQVGVNMAQQGAAVAKLAVASSTFAVNANRPAIVAAVSFITGIVRQGQSVANLALNAIRYAMNTILDIVRWVASFIPGLKLAPGPALGPTPAAAGPPQAGSAAKKANGAKATTPDPKLKFTNGGPAAKTPGPTTRPALPTAMPVITSAQSSSSGSASASSGSSASSKDATKDSSGAKPGDKPAGPDTPKGDGVAGVATALHKAAQSIRDAAKKTSGGNLMDEASQFLWFLGNFAYASHLSNLSARGLDFTYTSTRSTVPSVAELFGTTHRAVRAQQSSPRQLQHAAIPGVQKVLDANRAQQAAGQFGPKPTPAESAAATQAKAPKDPPRFHGTYNMPIELRVSHETQVHQAMMAVRDHLMQSIGLARNEARLSISMLDARMGAFGF